MADDDDEANLVVSKRAMSRGWKIGISVVVGLAALWLLLHVVFDAAYGWMHM